MPTPLLNVAAAYIRVSDERQDEYSPDSQLKKTREYAAKEGYFIPDEYVFYDDGISAKTAKHRKEFNRMIAMAKEKDHPFDVIYVWKFSRFARNQEESMVYKNLLRKKNVSVVSVSEPIPEGHFGTLIERIIEWMDEFYLINLGAEVTRGMTEKASRGEPTCAPPYGYVMRDKMYYPDEDGAADVVREIFRRYADGAGMREIAVSLGARGIKTKYGNPPENRWIEYILNNPCYIGKIRWSLEGARAVSKRDYANQNIMTVDGHHEPLVTQELWEKVQERLEQQKKAYTKYARREQPIEYLLKGIVRCSSCGGAIAMSAAVSGKNRTRTMQCCNYSRGSCHISHSVTMPKLENSLFEAMERAADLKQFPVSRPDEAPKRSDDGIDYERLIRIEERKLDKIREAYIAGIDTLEQYASSKAEILTRIEDLKGLQNKNTPQTDFNPEAYAKKVLEVLRFVRRDDINADIRNKALKTVIEKVIYEKPKDNILVFFRHS